MSGFPRAGVTSVFTRSGAVGATTGDYTAAQVTNAADKSSAAEQSFTGPVGLGAGSDTSGVAAFTTATPSSGVALTPLATSDAMVSLPIVATTTGTAKVTIGPSTGAENTHVPVSALVALLGLNYTLRVPKGWKVVITITGVTVAIGTVNIQAC